MTKTENKILLFSITLCWAASYIFIKNLPSDFSSYGYLTMTCGIAAALMAAVFAGRLKNLSRSICKKGFCLSLLLSINLLLEKQGIARLDSANASFLASLSILIVPVLQLFRHKKPARNHMLGAGIILLGLCISNGFEISGFGGIGTLYMLGACGTSALYTVAVDWYVKDEDPVLISMVQMAFSALMGFVLWYREAPDTFWGIAYTGELLSNIFILAFFAKAYAYIALMFSQKYTDAVSVTVIASTEPVVTLGLSLLLPAAYGGGQSFKPCRAVGAVVIAAGAIIAGLSFSEGRKRHQVLREGEKNE